MRAGRPAVYRGAVHTRRTIGLWGLGFTVVILGGCPRDIEGLLCADDEGCIDGYVCVEEVCVRRDQALGPDGGADRDAGAPDHVTFDAGADAGPPGVDAGPPDSGRPDAGAGDAGDGGAAGLDGGPTDDAGADAGGPDAGGPDAGGADAGGPVGDVGPVVAFSFDELFGAVAHDGVAGLAGPVAGREDNAAYIEDGRYRGAMDVSDGRLNIGYLADQGLPYGGDMSAFSVCAWVRTSTPAAGDWQVVYQTGGATNGLVLGLSPAGVPAALARRTDPLSEVLLAGSTDVPPDTWTHLCASFGDGAFRLYADGVMVDEELPSEATFSLGVVGQGLGRINGMSSTFTGSNPAGSTEQFTGAIDDVQLFLGTLDDADIVKVMNTPAPAPGPALAWSFDDTAAAAVQSSGIEDLALTMAGVSDAGHTNAALLVPSVSETAWMWHPVGDSLFDEGTTRRTVSLSAWVWLDASARTAPRTVMQIGGGSNCLSFGFTDTLAPFVSSRHASVQSLLVAEGAVLSETWVHVAAVRDASTMQLFVDGAEVATGPTAGPAFHVGVGNALTVGAPSRPNWIEASCLAGADITDPTASQWLEGRVDDLRIYAYALDDSEILDAMATPVSP